MIRYFENKRIIKLDTADSSLVLGLFDEGYVLNLYYGSYIPDCNLWSHMTRHRSASFSPSDPVIPNESFSTDVEPMEYGCFGSGDFRISAIAVKNSDGNEVTDLRYDGHEIISGKPEIKGLPHIYLNNETEADTLLLHLRDHYTGLKVTLSYTVFNEIDAIVRSVHVVNGGNEAMRLERIFSLCLDLPTMDFDLLTLYGRHNKERTIERRRLAHGLQGVASRRGSSSHNQNPFAALLRHGANEDFGDAYGFNLLYSGNFELCIECDYSETSRLLLGIEPSTSSFLLEPGDEFQTPEAVSVYSSDGLGGMSRVFHKLYNQNLVRGRFKTEKRPLLINNWEGTYFDFDEQKLFEIAESAKEMGIEMLVMDDGWFGKRNDDTSSLGDWFVNEEKLKGGLNPLVERIHGIGMKFGIWFEPEMISPDSELYRAHPDWCVHVPGRRNSIARNQYVLDVSREDVRENLKKQMSLILSSCDINYLKWDFNRNLSEAGSAILPKERGGEFFHRFVLGTYELLEWLTSSFPDLLIEGCSGGGGRFDAGMLYYTPQIWTSDDTDPIERLSIQFGTSLCYPASSMGAHVSASKRAGFETKANIALWGSFGYELDPAKLSSETKEEIKLQTEEYHKYYDLIHYGELYRLLYPTPDASVCAWSFVSEDKTEVLLTVVRIKEKVSDLLVIKLKGLDKEKLYKNEEDGEVYSGALLMNAGIVLTNRIDSDGDSIKLHFSETKILD